jgi:hypothetical protein
MNHGNKSMYFTLFGFHGNITQSLADVTMVTKDVLY